jgi:alpha-tubulin suppressor-like RCC1 family protein
LTVAAVACGQHHCLVVAGSGEVYALGDQDCDDRDEFSDAPVAQLSRVVLSPGVRIATVSAGFNHSMALGDNGRLYAWGRNDNGQLGVGRWSDQLTHWRTPLQVTIDAVVSIAAGTLFSLAVTRDGLLFEWGKTPHATRSRLPSRSRIGTTGKAAAVAAGRQHTVVLTSDGRVLWQDQHKLSEWNAGDAAAAAVAISAGDSFGVFLTSNGDAMLMQRKYGSTLPSSMRLTGLIM